MSYAARMDAETFASVHAIELARQADARIEALEAENAMLREVAEAFNLLVVPALEAGCTSWHLSHDNPTVIKCDDGHKIAKALHWLNSARVWWYAHKKETEHES